MGDITKRLSRKEFECKCGCGFDTVDHELPYVLEECADYFEDLIPNCVRVRIYINSGSRCKDYNHQVGGSGKSQHILGRAADFYLVAENAFGRREQINDDEIADYLEDRYPKGLGIGRYIGRTHVDTRSGYARWDKR